MKVLRKTSLAFAAMLTAAALTAPAHAASKKILMVVWIGCEDVCKGVQDYV